jgi:hypothetical protein
MRFLYTFLFCCYHYPLWLVAAACYKSPAGIPESFFWFLNQRSLVVDSLLFPIYFSLFLYFIFLVGRVLFSLRKKALKHTNSNGSYKCCYSLLLKKENTNTNTAERRQVNAEPFERKLG